MEIEKQIILHVFTHLYFQQEYPWKTYYLSVALFKAFHRQMQFTWTKFYLLILQMKKMDL